jgi:hypothetical protein
LTAPGKPPLTCSTAMVQSRSRSPPIGTPARIRDTLKKVEAVSLKDSGAWPLQSLRQSFLNGSLTRLVDPDATLKSKIVEFVTQGDFGLASGKKTDGAYERTWFKEMLAPDEVAFEVGVLLLRKAAAESLRAAVQHRWLFNRLDIVGARSRIRVQRTLTYSWG